MSTPVNVWGPVIEGRAKRRRRRLLVLLIVPPVLALVVAAVALWASAQIPRVEVAALTAPSAPMHVLIVGSDSREQLTEDERRELTTGHAEGERADTIFVMTIDRGRVALLAFPRDLWVRRCDGTTGRINAAIAIDGPDCLVTTIRDVSGIEVQHYMEVTFGGFRDVVDAVGGVELCLPEPIADRDAGIDLPAGCQRLDGRDALGYVRVRKIDDDLQRIERQKTFLRALADELTAPSVVINPLRGLALARDVGGAVTLDRSMGPIRLARLVWGVRGLARGASVSHVVPATPRITSAGAWVLDPIVAEAETLFARYRSGAVLGEIEGMDLAEPLTPADVEVSVLNSAGVAGLATSTAERLEQAGFVVVAIDNAERRPTSLILHPVGAADAAQLVAGTLDIDAALDETNAVTVVTVLLGEDQQGARP